MSSFVINTCFYDGKQTENIRVEIGEELPKVFDTKVSAPQLSYSEDLSRRDCDKRVCFADLPVPEASDPKVSDPSTTMSSFVIDTCFSDGEQTDNIRVEIGEELAGRELSVPKPSILGASVPKAPILGASVPKPSDHKVSDPTTTMSSLVINACFSDGLETETIRVEFDDQLCGRELPVTKVSDPLIAHPEVASQRQKPVQMETIRVEFGDEVSTRKVSAPHKIFVPELSQPEFATRNCYRKRVAPAHSAPLEEESRTLCRRRVAPADSSLLGEEFSLLIIIVLFILLCTYVYLMTLPYGIPQARRPRVYVSQVQDNEYYHRFSYLL